MVRRFTCVCAVLTLCTAALAQFESDFEAYVVGPLTDLDIPPVGGGQDEWYLPVAGSNNFNVEAYGADTFGFPVNPDGCSQFITGKNEGATGRFGRAQHPMNWASADVWTASWDWCHLWTGVDGEQNDNIASWSMQNSATARYTQSLLAYAFAPTDLTIIGYLLHVDDLNLPAGGVFETPGVDWETLASGNWYRQTITFNMTTGQMLSTTLTDLTAGGATVTSDLSGLNWYMIGGAGGGGRPIPTDFRFFAGGGSGAGPAGNTLAYDNLNIVTGSTPPPPVACATCDPCDTDCNGTVNDRTSTTSSVS